MIQDSGKRQGWATGSVRDTDDGKGWPHCIPTIFIQRLAEHFRKGAEKYAKDNWKLGQPLSRYIDSAWRHLMATRDGKQDEDHAAATAWNVCCFMWTADAIERSELPPELDDLGVLGGVQEWKVGEGEGDS